MGDVAQPLKYQHIIAYFVEQIQKGTWKKEERLPSERELAVKLQVSRAALREALSILSIMGIIEIKSKEGIRIGSIKIAPFINIISPLLFENENMIQDMIQFRIAIETAACKQIIESSDLIILKSIVEQMKAENISIENGNELDWKFHQELIRCSKNSLMIQSMECVEQLLHYSVLHNRQKMKQSEHLDCLLVQHEAILERLDKGFILEATDLLEKHLKLMHS